MSAIKIKFVSRKINKIRWLPKSLTAFVTGSYNDEDNNICLWNFIPVQINGNGIEEADPTIISTVPISGDVTDLNVASEELLFASSSLGFISMFRITEKDLTCVHSWNKVHKFHNSTAATTGISVKGQNLASVGEDGKLCLFNISSQQKVREIESSDLCSFNCVCFLRHQEVVAGNSLGYLRLWDLRSPTDTSNLLILSREQRGVTCMNVHPTQTHILATGYEDGSLCIWDMRQERKPMSLLEAHSAAVSELLFHPTNPDFLYTSSIDGSLWQWDSSKLKSSLPVYTRNFEADTNQASTKVNSWLNCDANRHKLDVTQLFSQSWSCVNTLDINDSILLWGTDNEALCILNDIIV